MKRGRCFFIAVSVILTSSVLGDQPAQPVPVVPQDWTGTWMGTLHAGVNLRLVFNISKAPDGSYKATLDSIDQGASGIPTSGVVANGEHITINAATIGGTFEGTRDAEFKKIVGTWKQSGRSFPLELERQDKALVLNRPQEPKRPFPYDELELQIDQAKGGFKLGATLTLPKKGRPTPAVLLISGSGQQDRDESLMGHRPFLVLSDYLTRRGIAVLRVDDRGVGQSGGGVQKATTRDFADDAAAAVKFLKSRKEVDPKKIGLIGHSEGGIIAPMVAVADSNIAFMVLLAGTALPGEDILYQQGELLAKAQGAPDEAIRKQTESQRQIFAAIRNGKDEADIEAEVRKLIDQQIGTLSDEEKRQIGDLDQYAKLQAQAVCSPWFRFFLTYDPRPTLTKVKCPVLAINGAKDLQVPPKSNLPEIEKALRSAGNKDVTIKELPGLNHLFQTAQTGAVEEYGQIEETMSPVALEAIAGWILERTK